MNKCRKRLIGLRFSDGLLFKPLRTKLYLSNLKTHFVPRRKHSALVIKINQLMLYREIIAVCSEIHTKTQKYTVCAERRIAEC